MELKPINDSVEISTDATAPRTEVVNPAPQPQVVVNEAVNSTLRQPATLQEDGSSPEMAPPTSQVNQPVTPEGSSTSKYDFTRFVNGEPVPSDLSSISRFATAFGEQSMHDDSNQLLTSQGEK